MKLSRDELKVKLLAEAELVIDQLLEWNEANGAPTLSQIEEAVLKMRKRVSEQAANALIANQDTVDGSERPICAQCGQPMRNKGYRENQVESRAGSLNSKRIYYYCPNCQKGTFPPG
jgi:uncharacterized protein with PIN domain